MSYTSYDFPHTHFYETDLREILSMLNKLEKEYSHLVESIDDLNEWKKNHTKEYESLVKKLEALQNEINTFEDGINKAFDEFKTEEQQKFAELQAELQAQINSEITRLRAEVKAAITAINNLLEINNKYIIEVVENKLQKWLDNLPDYSTLMVLNPVRGYRTSIQIAINDLYSYAAVNAITAKEFDDLKITAIRFDNLMITAGEFDRNAKDRLGYKDPRFYMFSPFTGENVLIKEVVKSLAALHMNAITAIEFDTLAITAEEFDDKLITAYNFDWNGKAILI